MQSQEKKALEVDPKFVGRYALGGAITGASVASLLNLVRMIKEMHQERKEQLVTPETSEDTIVLTLPPKRGESKKNKKPETICHITHQKTMLVKGPPRGKQARRAYDGTFGVKTAVGWPTLTMGALAALGSGYAGAQLVNKLADMRREKQLRQELEAAQQEYLDMLQQGKSAEVLDELFDVPGLDKSANSFSTAINTPVAVAALLSILGAGGSAYITKRVLDEKLREAQQRGLDIPKVRRIVFKSKPGSEEDEEKAGNAEDIECIDAALGIMMDKIGTDTIILEEPQVKEAMVKENTSARQLFKLAQDADILMEYLRQTPTLRRMIQRAAMEKHPVYKHLRWTLGRVPGVQGMADKKLYEAANQMFSKYSEKMALSLPTDVLGSVVGSSIAGREQVDDIADAVVKAQEKVKATQPEPALSPGEMAERVQLVGADPEAQAYIEANKEKILKILEQMAAAGKLDASTRAA